MGDKTLLVLLIIFIVIGVFTYDQYITEKTGESPISRLLDYGGLGNNENVVDPNKTTVSKYATFQEGAEFHLAQLLNKLSEFKDQRQKLLQERNAIISQLIGLEDKALKVAELFAEEIKKEREEFSAYKPELDQLGQLLTETYNVNNLMIREKNYEKIKEKIYALNGNKDWGVSQKDIAELVEFINQTFVQKRLIPINNCQSDEECLAANVKQAQVFLNEVLIDFQQELTPRFVNAVKIVQKSRGVNSEQVIFGDVNETYVEQQDEYFRRQYNDLVQKLVKITPKDLNDLIQLHQELQIEERTILENIQTNSQRLSQRIEEEQQQLSELIEKIDKNKLAKFNDFFAILGENKIEKKTYFDQLVEIDKQLVQMSRHRSFEYRSFLRNVAALLEVDIKKLVEDRVYAANLNANYLNYRYSLEERRRTVGIKDIYQDQKQQVVVAPKQEPVAVQPENPIQEIKQMESVGQKMTTPKNVNVQATINRPDLEKQKVRQDTVMSDFDKARDKAKDNGF
ncbi:MAG: hypothetical protein AB7S78_12150 [Candidatus Omnitrophota bacterium]